jgi:hypothetical protein
MEESTVVSGKLEDSLRQEIESYIEGKLSGLKQEIEQLQSQLNESVTRLIERQSDVQIDGSLTASIMEHLRAAHEEGVDLAASESSLAKASSDLAIVKAAVSEIDEQRSQADILKTLVNRATAFAPRVAFFVIKGDQSIGWRARGFQGTVGDDAVRRISFSVSADTVIGEAAHSRTTWSGGPQSHSEDHLILNRLGDEPPQRVVAVPLVVRERTVAILYADSAALDSEAINLEALETLVRVASMAVELLAARTAPAKRVAESTSQPAETAAEQYVPAAYVPAREYDESDQQQVSDPAESPAAEAAPIIETTSEPPAVADEYQHSESSPMAESHQPEPAMADDYQHTEPSPMAESYQPTVPAQAPEAEPSATQTGARRRYGMDLDLPIEVAGDEERRLHSDARRFARLLVSEIKLYNEQKVAEGRSQHDLYERLREYIDRSREMYDKRVKPEVAKKYDYFHHELVSTLAEGDAEKLGDAYPGATVAAPLSS